MIEGGSARPGQTGGWSFEKFSKQLFFILFQIEKKIWKSFIKALLNEEDASARNPYKVIVFSENKVDFFFAGGRKKIGRKNWKKKIDTDWKNLKNSKIYAKKLDPIKIIVRGFFFIRTTQLQKFSIFYRIKSS